MAKRVSFSFLRNAYTHYTSIKYCSTTATPATMTMNQVKEILAKTIATGRVYDPLTTTRQDLDQYLPKTQGDLPTRTINDSLCSALIPLSTDIELQNKYVTFLKQVRFGRVLEDMDLFAVYVAQRHILNPLQPEDKPSPYTLVTALVDKMKFTDFVPKVNEDIRISGHVSWVGKSSLEITVWLEQKSEGAWQKITKGLFVIAARDATTTKSAIVNALVASDPEQEKILSAGGDRQKERRASRNLRLTKVIPTAEEQTDVHELFLRTVDIDAVNLSKRNIPENCTWMKNATLSNFLFCYPEDRNIHYKVFGGYLMRHALELSWGLSYLFCMKRPVVRAISDIHFMRAIEVNSLVRMHAAIVYTYKEFLQTAVYAETWDSSTGEIATTNSFHYTYSISEAVKEVFPYTYQEAMMYIDGRRHFESIMGPVLKK